MEIKEVLVQGTMVFQLIQVTFAMCKVGLWVWVCMGGIKLRGGKGDIRTTSP